MVYFSKFHKIVPAARVQRSCRVNSLSVQLDPNNQATELIPPLHIATDGETGITNHTTLQLPLLTTTKLIYWENLQVNQPNKPNE